MPAMGQFVGLIVVSAAVEREFLGSIPGFFC